MANEGLKIIKCRDSQEGKVLRGQWDSLWRLEGLGTDGGQDLTYGGQRGWVGTELCLQRQCDRTEDEGEGEDEEAVSG